MTHLLQPLDVGIFQPMKHWHAEQIDRATRSGCTSFNKVEFLAALPEISRRTFKEASIRSSFAKSGLVPYDPDVVIDQMPDEPRLPASHP